MAETVSGKSRLLVRLQDGFEKDMTSNKLTIVTVDSITVTEEAKVNMIMQYLTRQLIWKRDYIIVSICYYILITGMVLIERGSRKRLRLIQTSRRWMTRYSMMKGIITGRCFFRTRTYG